MHRDCIHILSNKCVILYFIHDWVRTKPMSENLTYLLCSRISLYNVQLLIENVPGPHITFGDTDYIAVHNPSFLHAKPGIPGGEKSIFTVVIH